jgi:hypothetical protein
MQMNKLPASVLLITLMGWCPGCTPAKAARLQQGMSLDAAFDSMELIGAQYMDIGDMLPNLPGKPGRKIAQWLLPNGMSVEMIYTE